MQERSSRDSTLTRQSYGERSTQRAGNMDGFFVMMHQWHGARGILWGLLLELSPVVFTW